MSNYNKSISLALLLFIFPQFAIAHGDAESSSVKREFLTMNYLPQLTQPKLTSLTVELNPGQVVGAHIHDGFVYAYVLEGKVRSKLYNGEEVVYEKGDYWIEPQGAVHTLTANMSEMDTAKILVMFISEDGAKINRPLDLN